MTRHLRRHNCPDEALYNIVLCADELAANAVRHTASGDPGGRLVVTIRLADNTARIEVADHGPPQDPTRRADDRDKSNDEYDDGGRGLLLVDALTHWSGYETNKYGGLAWFEYTLVATTSPS